MKSIFIIVIIPVTSYAAAMLVKVCQIIYYASRLYQTIIYNHSCHFVPEKIELTRNWDYKTAEKYQYLGTNISQY